MEEAERGESRLREARGSGPVRLDAVIVETPSVVKAAAWRARFAALRGSVLPPDCAVILIPRSSSRAGLGRLVEQWPWVERAFREQCGAAGALWERIARDGWCAAYLPGGEFSLMPLSWAAGGSWTEVRLPGRLALGGGEADGGGSGDGLPMTLGIAALLALRPLCGPGAGRLVAAPAAALALLEELPDISCEEGRPVRLRSRDPLEAVEGGEAEVWGPTIITGSWLARLLREGGELEPPQLEERDLGPRPESFSFRRPWRYLEHLRSLADAGSERGRMLRGLLGLAPHAGLCSIDNRVDRLELERSVAVECRAERIEARDALLYRLLDDEITGVRDELVCDVVHPEEGRIRLRAGLGLSKERMNREVRQAAGLRLCAVHFLVSSNARDPEEDRAALLELARDSDGVGTPGRQAALIRMARRGDPLGRRLADRELERRLARICRRPLVPHPDNFTPLARTPWGGRRITTQLKAHLALPPQTVGESWEISAHPSFPSYFDLDERRRVSLPTLVSLFPEEILGERLPEGCLARFPLLIKIIDAEQNLSVQVHPPDDYGGLPPHETGKTEAWHILAAEPGAGIYLELREGVTKARLRRAVSQGEEVNRLLHFVPARAGDTFLIPPGTVHAIGKGITLLEVQQSSEATYRLWDWNRRYDEHGRPSKRGKPRTLHIEDALAVTRWPEAEGGRGKARETDGSPTASPLPAAGATPLVHCRYFAIHRLELRPGEERRLAGGRSFLCLVLTRGTFSLPELGLGPWPAVQSMLLPAACPSVSLCAGSGGATLLLIAPSASGGPE
jgi:mannose-6-phosphate isomerase